MYNNYVLFLIGLFVFTILIQYLDKQLEQKQDQEQKQIEGFKRRWGKTFKKARRGITNAAKSTGRGITNAAKSTGRDIKNFAQSPAGIGIISGLAGGACMVASMGVAAPACLAIAGGIAGGIGGSIIADNKRKKKRYKRDRNREHKRRCRVLTGRENPHYNGKSPHFEGKESILNPCREFRESNCANQESARCNYLNTQCRLARSCTFYDSHLIDQGQSGGIEESKV